MSPTEASIYEEILEASDMGLVALDSGRRVIAWNSWIALASRIPASEAVGRTLEALFPEDDLALLATAASTALTQGASRFLSNRLHRNRLPGLLTRGGEPMVYDLVVAPLGRQPFERCLLQVVDVTVATERERVLRSRQNARYAAIVDTAPDAILTMDADGVIQNLNRAAAGVFGYDREELINRSVHQLFQASEAWPQVWREILQGHPVPLVEFGARRKDGSTTYLEVSASRWLDEDRVFVSAIFRDVNDRRAARDAMARLNVLGQAQLETERDAAELREQFIAVLGHDLRNPLASVNGAARMLRREVQSEKSLKILGLMEDSADRMAALIDNVLDFARGRLGGGISLDRTVGPLEPVLRQVIAELTSDRPDRLVHVDIDIAEPLSFDRVRIGQLVSNLLGNAFTHGDPGQPVLLEARNNDGVLVLSIANHGPSISKAALERLFQPFFRGEVKPSQQGLGLGLHIASEIAKAHGGTLVVRSSDELTVFVFEMPIP